jgi:alkylation response protein AidB-like acyl-CoA dehydrogenase
MNWDDTPRQAQFRKKVWEFIRDQFPADYTPDLLNSDNSEPDDVPGYNWPADIRSENSKRREAAIEWGRRLCEKGWVAPHWPTEYGGGGLSVMEHFIFTEEMARARVPTVGGIGVTLLGPSLIEFGTDEQKREHLPRIVSGEVLWAQGFSEPEAGSDLASLSTRAVLDGDHYVVNGQKIWTSHAQYADWLFILVRTDFDAMPKHRGITFLLLDAKSPGVEIRPIRDMSGEEPFNEVFFNDVRVPVRNRVGEENRGWYVAMATLDFERSGVGAAIGDMNAITDLIEQSRSGDGRQQLRGDWDSTMRQEVAERYIELRVLYNLALRTADIQESGRTPNYEASISKLFGSEVHQRVAQTRIKALGLDGNLWKDETAPLEGRWARDYINSISHTVLSGSSEILRNVIATRGLGLPRD